MFKFFSFFNIGVIMKTQYDKSDLLLQSQPALELAFTIRTILNIKPGDGNIVNAEESMVYKFTDAKKGWVVC